MRQDVDDFLIHICLFSNEWIISFIAAIHVFQVHVGQFKRGCLLDTERTLWKKNAVLDISSSCL